MAVRLQKPIIQVAGIADADEARMLVGLGIRWLGFPLRLSVHREDLTEREAARIIENLPRDVFAVLITYAFHWKEVLDLCAFLGARAVQLHGETPVEDIRRIKAARPGLVVIKSVIVRPGMPSEDLEQTVMDFAPYVDALITDTFDPETGACGATGKTHDWEVSRRIVEVSPKPVILAGGLTPENVAEAVRKVRPFGVDAHTGLEDPSGRKDPRKVAAFVRNAWAAFSALY
ncbi:MAG: phosphoribosylanthranilate isomerase [Desulfosoma sp.]